MGKYKSYPGLTPHQQEIVCMVAQGRSNRDIAEKLVISRNTVNQHLARISEKIGTRNRAQLALYAARTGLIAIESEANDVHA